MERSSRLVYSLNLKLSSGVVRPFPIALTIIGTKLDQIRNLEPELCKILFKFLRLIGHVNGGTVFTVSQSDDGSLLRVISTNNILVKTTFESFSI